MPFFGPGLSPLQLDTAAPLQSIAFLLRLPGAGSSVRPKVVKSVHYCPATTMFSSREYRDVTALTGAPTPAVYPTKVCDLMHSTHVPVVPHIAGSLHPQGAFSNVFLRHGLPHLRIRKPTPFSVVPSFNGGLLTLAHVDSLSSPSLAIL